MATAFTTLLGLALPVTGELSGSWGDAVNTAITSLLDSAVSGTTTITVDADITLTTSEGVANEARQAILLWTASGTVTRNITAPARSKAYFVVNKTGSTQSIVIRGAGPTTGVTVLAGTQSLVVWDGVDFVEVASGNVDGPATSTDNAVARFDGTTGKLIQNSVVTIADSTGNMAGVGTLGVGAITTSGALTYGGITLSNAVTGTGNMVLSTSPTLVTPALGTPASGVLTNATGLPISTGVSELGTGVATFLATPTSANLAAAVTDETGSGSLVFATNPTLVTPALGTPSALVGTNITGTASGLTAGNVTTNANLTGMVTSVGNVASLGSFTSANLAAALTDETGSGSAVFATSPTLVTPILGTPTSVTLTNATGLPIATGVSGLGTGVATFLATPTSANLAAAVTNETGTGSLVFATSPTLVTPALGTPSSGVLTNATGLPIATGVSGLGTGVATFLATPSSANLAAAVTNETGTGALVFATSPTLVTPALGTPSALVGTNITGTATSFTSSNVTTNANLTGSVTSVGNATTVVTNANLTGMVTSVGNATTVVTNANLTGGVTSVGNAATVVTNANLTGAVTSTGNATLLGSFTSAQLAGALTDETGSGANVFATSPTLVTPALGTPSSVVLTNATGLPIATGVSGLGTGVATFLATPNSANLRTAVTDETGTGALVFATSPTFVTPALGTPASGVVTNLTGTASININGTVGATTPNTGNFTVLTENASPAVVQTDIGTAPNEIPLNQYLGSMAYLDADNISFDARGTNTAEQNLAINKLTTVIISAATTLTTTVPLIGSTAFVIVITSGTTSRTVTFGTGFKSTGTLATGTNADRRFVFQFISDGANLVEVSRTVAITY